MYKIFIVDDDRRVVTTLSNLLAVFNGIKVVGCAANEISAVEWLLIDQSGWDFVIVDLALRSGSAMRVLSACRVRRAGQKVVVLSDHLDSTMRRKCELLGADAIFERNKQIDLVIKYCVSAAKK